MVLRHIKGRAYRTVPYIKLIGSLYAMLNTRLNVYFAVGIVSKYQLNQRSLNLVRVKHILIYLRTMRDYMLVHKSEVLMVTGCTNAD